MRTFVRPSRRQGRLLRGCSRRSKKGSPNEDLLYRGPN
jgi:hypothetical protein